MLNKYTLVLFIWLESLARRAINEAFSVKHTKLFVSTYIIIIKKIHLVR